MTPGMAMTSMDLPSRTQPNDHNRSRGFPTSDYQMLNPIESPVQIPLNPIKSPSTHHLIVQSPLNHHSITLNHQ